MEDLQKNESSNNELDNKQKITIMKKIILSYLEQYMLYQLDQQINSDIHLDRLVEDQKLKSLFRVVSRGLLSNADQFVKSRKWMDDRYGSSIKNITITSLNIIPEENQENNSDSSLVESENELRQVSSSESMNNALNTSAFSKETAITGSCENYISKQATQNGGINGNQKYESGLLYDNLDYVPGFILGKLSFITATLESINKLLTNSALLGS